MGDRTYAVDANNFLADGAAALTASGYAQYGGADGIIDLGGNQNITVTLPSIAASSSITPQQARIDAAVVIDVTAFSERWKRSAAKIAGRMRDNVASAAALVSDALFGSHDGKRRP